MNSNSMNNINISSNNLLNSNTINNNINNDVYNDNLNPNNTNNMNMNNTYLFNTNSMHLNPMSLNNGSGLNNTTRSSMQLNPPFFNNNSIMPQPLYCNSYFQNINQIQFPNSYPIMNNTLNLNRINFIDINDFNRNSNDYLNNSFGSINLADSLSFNNSFDGDNEEEYNKLKKQFIKELDVYQYKNKDKFENALIEDECSICLCKYKMTDMLQILPCKHCFHKKCIKKWLSNEEHNKCPLCNLDIKAEINKRKADLKKHIYDAEHEEDD